MSPRLQLGFAGVAVGVLTAWNARDLLLAWWHSPYDRFGWAAAVVWFAPLPFVRRKMRAGFFFAGLFCSLAGALAELNALTYAGAALAWAGFAGGDARVFPWLAAAVSWMPLFGWFVSPLGIDITNGLRVALATAGSALLLRKSHA